MPRKRGVRSGSLGAQANISSALSPTTDGDSGGSCTCIHEAETLQTTAVAEPSSAQCGVPPKGPGGEESAYVSIHARCMESTDTPEANAFSLLLTSHEDACAFHSPRSLPGDTTEEGPSISKTSLEETALSRDPLGTPEFLPVNLSQAEALAGPSNSFQAGHSDEQPMMEQERQTEQQPQQPTDQSPRHEEEKQQEGQHNGLQENKTNDGAPHLRTCSMSESEGEWIRVEEPHREITAKTNSGTFCSCPECPYTQAEETLFVQSSRFLPSGSQLPQGADFPICIGSAIQAEEGAGADGNCMGIVGGIIPREANKKGSGGISTSPKEGFFNRNTKKLLARISGFALALASSVSGRCSEQEQQDEDALPCGTEVTDLPSQTENNEGKRSRLLEKVVEWHRCLLELYGGPVEDITRLALQVLPAQANDDQSERRLLVIQGLFDVFCLYRAHFLSPPEGLLQAEAVHQQWQLRAESSRGPATRLKLPGTPIVSSATPLFVEGFLEEGTRVERLPLSVRLALYGAASLALKVVRALQLLLEVNQLRTGGQGPRFALCLRLELLKLVLKMILSALTPFAFYCDEQSISQALDAHRDKQMIGEANRLRPCYGRRTGRRILPLPSAAPHHSSSTSISLYDLRIVATGFKGGMIFLVHHEANEQQAAIVTAARQPLPRQWGLLVTLWLLKELKTNLSWSRLYGMGRLLASNSSWRPVLGEVLYHVRPFVHLYLLKRAKNTKSWTPWLAAFLIEANSLSLLHGSPQVMERLSPIEAAELRRRLTGLPYALLRPPFFDKFLARPFEAIDYIVRRVPLLNHFK